MTSKNQRQGASFRWPATAIVLIMLVTGCATVDHTHPQYETDMKAVQEATQRANAAAERANAAATRAEQASSRSEAAAVRAERAAVKAEAIFKKGLRK